MLQRLDKILVSQGKGSRSEVQRLIRRGCVTADGAVLRDPAAKVDPDQTALALNGRPLTYAEHLYIMMNKPAGLLCVSRDPKQPTVLDKLPPSLQRPGLFPAGRLDKDTVGFTLITDDGDFAHRLLAPRRHVPKTYQAVIDAPLQEGQPEAFTKGLLLEDGTPCLPAKLRLLQPGEHPLVEVCITEGKYPQIKRMFGVFGHKVLWLKRTAMGGLWLDDTLAEGEARALSPEELACIWK